MLVLTEGTGLVQVDRLGRVSVPSWVEPKPPPPRVASAGAMVRCLCALRVPQCRELKDLMGRHVVGGPGKATRDGFRVAVATVLRQMRGPFPPKCEQLVNDDEELANLLGR